MIPTPLNRTDFIITLKPVEAMQRTMGGPLAAEWFSARDDAMKLWD